MKSKSDTNAFKPNPASERLFTLEVTLHSGLATEKFSNANPIVSRTIQIRGNQTLSKLHRAIYDAFDRYDEHMYDFRIGKQPYSRGRIHYVLSSELKEAWPSSDHTIAGSVTKTTMEELELKAGKSFWYIFDYGDEWIHKITISSIDDQIPDGKYPRVIKKIGASPPQYINEEDEWDEIDEEENED